VFSYTFHISCVNVGVLVGRWQPCRADISEISLDRGEMLCHNYLGTPKMVESGVKWMNDKAEQAGSPSGPPKKQRGRPPIHDGVTNATRYVRRERGRMEGMRPVNIRKVILWVFNSLDSELVFARDAPCAGAWSMLQWAKKDADSRDLFFKNYVVKLLPSRAQMETEEAQADDDGKHLAETIKRLLGIADAAQRAGAQGDAGEPGISAEGAGRGAEG